MKAREPTDREWAIWRKVQEWRRENGHLVSENLVIFGNVLCRPKISQAWSMLNVVTRIELDNEQTLTFLLNGRERGTSYPELGGLGIKNQESSQQ